MYLPVNKRKRVETAEAGMKFTQQTAKWIGVAVGKCPYLVQTSHAIAMTAVVSVP
jgi:hypothetical protein